MADLQITGANFPGGSSIRNNQSTDANMAGVVKTFTGLSVQHGFALNLTYEQAANTLPAGFQSALNFAASYLSSIIKTPITVNIQVGWGTINGQPIGAGAVGNSVTNLISTTYATLLSGLSAAAPAIAQSIPQTQPVTGTFWLAYAQAKAFNIGLPPGSTLDGFVGFSNTVAYTFDPNNRAVANQYDFIGAALHELTEVLGRIDLFGVTVGTTANSYMMLDLFHYTSSGTHTYTGTTTNYFSVDSGASNLNNFNIQSGGDVGDWASTVPADACMAFLSTGQVNPFTNTDVTLMNALGYGLSFADGLGNAPIGTSPTNTTSPTAVLQLATALNQYATGGVRNKADTTRQPPWNVAGVDYRVGIQSGITLTNPGGTAGSTITFATDGQLVQNLDFSINGNFVAVTGNNVTFKNCRFGNYSGKAGFNITYGAGNNRTYIYCEFDGTGYNSTNNPGIVNQNSHGMTVQYCAFLNPFSDFISSGSGNILLQYNLFVVNASGAIQAGAHPDVWQASSTEVVPINSTHQFNTVIIAHTTTNMQVFYMASNNPGTTVQADWAASQDVGWNTLIRFPGEASAVKGSGNGEYTSFFAGNSFTTTNVHDNYGDLAACWNPAYQSTTGTVRTNNWDVSSGTQTGMN